jgi:hypothetical protein
VVYAVSSPFLPTARRLWPLGVRGMLSGKLTSENKV